MLRLIVRETDIGSAANIGGPVTTTFKSFDVDIPHVELFLDMKALPERTAKWLSREVIGVEIIQSSAAEGIATRGSVSDQAAEGAN